MKHAFLCASFFCSAILALGQSRPPEVPFQATTQILVGSRLYLRGNVQIGNAQLTFVHADEVDFNVATGAIEARGNVRITWGPGILRLDHASGSLGPDRWLFNKMGFSEIPELLKTTK